MPRTSSHSYLAHTEKYQQLKEQLLHYANMQQLPQTTTVESYLGTHLFTLSLRHTRPRHPADEVDLRTIVETCVRYHIEPRSGDAIVVPLALYSDQHALFHPVQGGHGETIEVATVLWPWGYGALMFLLFVGLAGELVRSGYFGFRYWSADFDEGDLFKTLERTLHPAEYMKALAKSVRKPNA